MARTKFSIPASVTRTSLPGQSKLIYSEPIAHALEFVTPGAMATAGRPLGWLNEDGMFQRYGTGEILPFANVSDRERASCVETGIIVNPALVAG